MTWMQILCGVLVMAGCALVIGSTLATKHTEVRALGSVTPQGGNSGSRANRGQKILNNIIVGACLCVGALMVVMTWL